MVEKSKLTEIPRFGLREKLRFIEKPPLLENWLQIVVLVFYIILLIRLDG